MHTPRHRPLILALLLASCALPAAARQPDLRVGKDINEVCAGCHGEFGEGGKGGEYPRLAGLPYSYILKEMHLFRERKRPNLPMNEYVDERQAPDADIEDVAGYLSSLTLASKLPPLREGQRMDGFERLQQAKMVLNIARAEGDAAKGERLYNQECRSCHGDRAQGRTERSVPMLAGQYTAYLWRQIELYRTGARLHDPADPQEQFLKSFTDAQLRDLFAWLSVADDD